MITVILFIFLVFILILAYLINNYDFISPSFLFIGPFSISVLCAAIYSDAWDLNLNLNTFLVMSIYPLIFVLFAYLTHLLFKKRNNAYVSKEKKRLKELKVSNFKLCIFILLELVSLYLTIKSMEAAVAQYGSVSGLSNVMFWYRQLSMYSDKEISIPGIVIHLRRFCIASSFVWIYVFLYNNILKVRQNKLTFILQTINIVLALINSMITGARGEAIMLIISGIILYFLLIRYINGKRFRVPLKQITKIIILLIIILVSFKGVGTLLGRITDSASIFEEISKYLGAMIKNLDTFLNSRPSLKSNVFGEQTFYVLIDFFNSRIGTPLNISYYQPFLKVNEISLGNVYTCYMPYIYDFGYLGAGIIVSIMSFASQFVYEKTFVSNAQNRISFQYLIYCYLGYTLVFSFFSERFYWSFINPMFLEYLVYWFITTFFIKKHIKKRF